MIIGPFSMISTTPKSIHIANIEATGVTQGLTSGTVLFASDEEHALQPRDHEVEMNADQSTSRMLIWDFAAEDGDVVEVRINGSPTGQQVNLLNRPALIEVPVPSTIEIVGIRDGVGGITYGVKFPGNPGNGTYFNVAPEGSANTYTLYVQ